MLKFHAYGLVDVVPTSLCSIEYIKMEMMFPLCFVHYYHVSCMMRF